MRADWPAFAPTLFPRGIDPKGGRIVWAGRMSLLAYLQAFNQIDIALDCYPYNGHTTSCDGFWMGVPLITLAGGTYVSRMGASLLTNMGLPEWIARTPEEYVSLAVSLAGDRARLAELRRTMRARFEGSALTDGAALARDIEAAYREMWVTWCGNK